VLQEQAAKINAQISKNAGKYCSLALFPAELINISKKLMMAKSPCYVFQKMNIIILFF
jgi:hypothetical protein